MSWTAAARKGLAALSALLRQTRARSDGGVLVEWGRAFDVVPDGVLLVDPSGLIRFVNSRASELLGYSAESLLGRPVEVLIPHRYQSAHPGHRDTYQRAPHVRRMGARMSLKARRASGDELSVDIALGTAPVAGQVMTLVFMRDASAQQALWDELSAAKARVDVELSLRRRYRSLTELMQASSAGEQFGPVLGLHLERLFPGTTGEVMLLDEARSDANLFANWGGGAAGRCMGGRSLCGAARRVGV